MDERETIFRILVVEDQLDVLNDLQRILIGRFPLSQVDTAATIAEAKAAIRRQDAGGWSYDLAILDFKLPPQKGKHVKVDTSMCELLRDRGIRIVHITAYAEDTVIKTHIEYDRECHTLTESPVLLVVKTATQTWIEELLSRIDPFFRAVATKRVKDQFARVLSAAGPKDAADERVARLATAQRSATYAIIDLHTLIVELWQFLSPELKAKIENTFAVVDLDGPDKRLCLYKPDEELNTQSE